MARRVARVDTSIIVYDDSLVSHIQPESFEPDTWTDSPTAPGYAGGRGNTLFIELSGRQCVLRHYYRGGAIGRFVDDRFFWPGFARSRPNLEWSLLARLANWGLPVPVPLAARANVTGIVYTADLITVRLPDVVPLSTRLSEGPLGEEGWRRVGEVVGKFHQRHVFHADLTAHNIQIDTNEQPFLLDFDRGRVMPGVGNWCRQNLARLHRSLVKISADGSIGFGVEQWQWLEAGYASCGLSV